MFMDGRQSSFLSTLEQTWSPMKSSVEVESTFCSGRFSVLCLYLQIFVRLKIKTLGPTPELLNPKPLNS